MIGSVSTSIAAQLYVTCLLKRNAIFVEHTAATYLENGKSRNRAYGNADVAVTGPADVANDSWLWIYCVPNDYCDVWSGIEDCLRVFGLAASDCVGGQWHLWHVLMSCGVRGRWQRGCGECCLVCSLFGVDGGLCWDVVSLPWYPEVPFSFDCLTALPCFG